MRWFAFTLAIAAIAGGCSTKSNPSTTGPNGSSGNGSGGSDINVGNGGSGAGISVGNGGGPPVISGATIVSADGNEITTTGTTKDVQLTATLPDGSPVAGGTWTTDDTTVGSVGADGVLHLGGFVGGEINISLLVGAGQIKTTIVVNVDIVQNPATLSEADQTALKAGGASDPNFKFLYPHDNTVFPRGLPAPLLQFGDGKTVTGTASGTFLKMTTSHFSYQQFGLGGTPVRVAIPEDVWKGATLSARSADPLTVSVTKRTGTTISAPVTSTWTIAQGTLKGFIYYSTYKSPLLPYSEATKSGGGILRIKPGVKAPEIVRKGCVVCHSVSAQGNVLTASWGPDLANPDNSDAVNLDPASATPTARGPARNLGQQYSFAALSPDGTLAVTNGNPALAPPYKPHGLDGNYESILVNTSTGMPVASPTLTQFVKRAQSPMFSPDGKHLVFVNADVAPEKRVLAMLDFDGVSTFSNYKVLRTETETTTNWNASSGASKPPPGAPQPKTIAWPSFLPDSAGIIYHSGDSFDSSGFNFGSGTGTSFEQYAELRLMQTDGTVKKLNNLNGRDAAGASILPYGETLDGNLNYEPNVMPLPVGGYYWVVFTSRRAYGNKWGPGRAKTTDTFDDPTQDPWGSNAFPSPRKKLWVAAIDLNHADPTNLDPSHPAFYLPGQEDESANMRGFAALAPCQQMGASCESGADCCDGFCRQNGNDPSGKPVLQCIPPPENTCSGIDEPCETSADCCDPGNLCIANRCAEPPPVK